MMAPPLLTMCTFFQILGFAFSPDFSWNKSAAEPAQDVQRIFLIDYSLFAKQVDDNMTRIEYSSIIGALIFALLFCILTLCDVVNWANKKMTNLESSAEFRLEVFEERDGSVFPPGSYHIWWKRFRLLRKCAASFVWLGSSLALVAIIKKAVLVFDCERCREVPSGGPKECLSW